MCLSLSDDNERRPDGYVDPGFGVKGPDFGNLFFPIPSFAVGPRRRCWRPAEVLEIPVFPLTSKCVRSGQLAFISLLASISKTGFQGPRAAIPNPAGPFRHRR